jgi:hypothetical protein
VKCINDRTVLSTVDVHWWMISNWSNGFSKYNRILHHYSVSTAAALCYRKWRHNRKWGQSRDRKWPITRSDVSHVTGSDVIFPRFFLTSVVQNIPLHGKLKDTERPIRSRTSNDKQHNDGSTEQQQYSQSNDEESYYILKTNNTGFLLFF